MKFDDLLSIDYEEYLEANKKYEGIECIVGWCNKPGYYEGGDIRCWCPMCEEHSGVRDRYLYPFKRAEENIRIRMMWDKDDDSLQPLLDTIVSRIKEIERKNEHGLRNRNER